MAKASFINCGYTYLIRDCFVPRNDALYNNYAAFRRKIRIRKT